MKRKPNASTTKVKTESKTLRLKQTVIAEIDALAEQNNRNFNNMAETLMKLGMERYATDFNLQLRG